jgi:hypothetical protein
MRSRRALVWLLATLVIALGAISAAQRDERRPRESSPAPTATPADAPAASAADPAEVRGELPADRVVRARPGDLVTLSVRSDVPDVARIAGLGVAAAVGPQIAGELRFEAFETGRFPVKLQLSGRTVGTVEIAAPAD